MTKRNFTGLQIISCEPGWEISSQTTQDVSWEMFVMQTEEKGIHQWLKCSRRSQQLVYLGNSMMQASDQIVSKQAWSVNCVHLFIVPIMSMSLQVGYSEHATSSRVTQLNQGNWRTLNTLLIFRQTSSIVCKETITGMGEGQQVLQVTAAGGQLSGFLH